MFKLKALTLILLSVLFLLQCTSSHTTKLNQASDFFKKEKEKLETVKQFLIQASGEKYDFASLDFSNNMIRLTLGADGIQESKTVTNSSAQEALNYLIKQKQIYIFKEQNMVYFLLGGHKKHGKESGYGVLYSLDSSKPKINLSWVEDYSLEKIEKDWYAYTY